ncbi:hypothetical protein Tco_0467891 [Tanacetum coccineum]
MSNKEVMWLHLRPREGSSRFYTFVKWCSNLLRVVVKKLEENGVPVLGPGVIYIVAIPDIDNARDSVMLSTSLTQEMVSAFTCGSISFEGFLSSICCRKVEVMNTLSMFLVFTARVPVRLLALAMAAVCASRAAVKSAVSYNVVEEEDGEWIRFLGGNSSSGTKKYRGSNSSDGGNTGDGVKIAGEAIGSGDKIEFFEELKEMLPDESGK